MGFSLKSVAKSIGSLGSSIGTAAGYYFGGPTGALIGSQVGDGISSLVQQDTAEASAKKAFERNLYMWNLNNAYNDPSAQMMRLKAAGLNPNLVYGSGSVVGNTSNSGYGDYSYNVYKPSKSQMVQEYQQLLANDASIKNLAAETAVKGEQAGYYGELARKEGLQADILQYDKDFYTLIENLFGSSGKASGGFVKSFSDFLARGGVNASARQIGLLFRGLLSGMRH